MSDTIYNYYIYAYINKRTGRPYYIGKGKGNRAFVNHGRVTVPKNKDYIVFCETNLSNVGACALERRLIRLWGKKSDNTGILLNLTDGGEGGLGGNTYVRTDEIKEKIRKTNLKKGINFVSNGATDAAAKVTKGKKQSPEHVRKRAEGRKGKGKKIRINGIIYNSCREAAEAHNVLQNTISVWLRKGKAECMREKI